ncbi:MAG TPA: DMT family transporter [Anaeromyxobacteraceae bacterium]|nr:DMT family transporter [Anaeromyxobacteraceae bacterium]
MANSDGAALPVPSRARARTLLFGAGALFGLAAVLVKLACRGPDGMSGGQATLMRFAVGLAAVVALFVARPGTFRPVKYGLLISRGLFGGAAALLYYVAIELLPAGEATLLNNTFPIFAVLISFFLLGERPTGHLALALAIASAGVWLVLGGGEMRFGLGAGELVGLASAALGGAAVTSIRALRATDNAPTIFFAMALGGLLVSVPFAFHAWPSGPLPWVAAAACGLVAFVAQLLMTEAYGTLSVAEAALWQQLTPIASFVMALSIGERLGGTAVLGVALGVAGVAYGSVLGHRPGPDAPAAQREAAAGITAEEP